MFVSGKFDVLPLVLSGPDGVPKIYEIPEDIVMKVKIKHPTLPEIEKMNLEWYALPAVSGKVVDKELSPSKGASTNNVGPFWRIFSPLGTPVDSFYVSKIS